MDRATAKAIHQEIDAAMAGIAAKHGMLFTQARARFGPGMFRMRVELQSLDAAVSEAERNILTGPHFEFLAPRYGLQPADLGRTFSSNGRRFKVEGLNPNRPKYPVSAVRVPDGKRFKFPALRVKNLLEMENGQRLSSGRMEAAGKNLGGPRGHDEGSGQTEGVGGG